MQPCFNRAVLAELTDSATTHISEIEALIESQEEGSGRSDGEQIKTGELFYTESELIRSITRGDETFLRTFVKEFATANDLV